MIKLKRFNSSFPNFARKGGSDGEITYCHVTEDTLFLEMEKFEKRCS